MQPHHPRSPAWAGSIPRRHGREAVGTFCRQRGDGGAISGGAGLPGTGRLPACTARSACTNALRRRSLPPCAPWAIELNPPTTGCQPTLFGAGPRQRPARWTLAKVRNSRRLFCSAPVRADGMSTLAGRIAEEAPYVAMTRNLIAAFPARGGEFQIEADASSASYFCAANWLLRPGPAIDAAVRAAIVAIPSSDWQIDAAFPRFLPLPRGNFAAQPAWRQHHDGDDPGAFCRQPDALYRLGAAARSGMRAGGGAARRN